MPVQYAGIVAEHKAVREAAGLFDVSHMGEIEISGAGARDACALLFSNDSYKLAPGRAGYSLLPNERGGLLDDVIVYCLADDRFLVCVNASNAAKDFAWIHEHGCALADIRDLSEETALIAIQGPKAVGIVAQLDPQAATIERFGLRLLTLEGVEVMAARTGYTGEDGLELFLAAEQAAALWARLLEAGAAEGLVPVGLGARDTLRLEAALPLYGHELGEDISPFEARVGWAVKLDRPQMLGFEALAAAKARGPQRKLIGLRPSGGIAREGAPVYEEGSPTPIGHVTSGSHAPGLGHAIAIASIAIGELSTPDSLEIEIRGKRRSAAVTGLPFYVRQAS